MPSVSFLSSDSGASRLAFKGANAPTRMPVMTPVLRPLQSPETKVPCQKEQRTLHVVRDLDSRQPAEGRITDGPAESAHEPFGGSGFALPSSPEINSASAIMASEHVFALRGQIRHCVFPRMSFARLLGVLRLRFALGWIQKISHPPCQGFVAAVTAF